MLCAKSVMWWAFILHFRKEEVESKYYADGEDAFAMKRDLVPVAEALKQEEEHRKKRQQKERAPAESQIASPWNSIMHFIMNFIVCKWLFMAGRMGGACGREVCQECRLTAERH